jgi:hypothetical protein
MKKLIFILMLILLVNNITAAVPIVVPVHTTTETNHGANCMPPIQFTIDHNCELTYDGDRSINTYYCTGEKNYKVTGDCNGGIISYKESDTNPVLFVIGVFILIGIVTWLFILWIEYM